LIRSILLYTLLPLLFITFYPGEPLCDCSQSQPSTLFYQPWQSDIEKSDIFWNNKFAEIKNAGFSTLLVQWSVYGEINYATSTIDTDTRSEEPSFLARLLTMASQYNINIIIGLYNDPGWFAHIKEDPLALDFYLRKIRSKHLAQARKISDEFKDHPALTGWYLPEEIDDKEWRSPEKQKLLTTHLQESTHQLAPLAPGRTVMISSFFAGFMTPDSYSSMLTHLQEGNNFLWLIQDGLGTGRLSTTETSRYLQVIAEKALRDTLAYKGILEIFTQSAKDKKFVPASAAESTERKNLWCEKTQAFPEFSFSLRYRFPFTD